LENIYQLSEFARSKHSTTGVAATFEVASQAQAEACGYFG